MNNLLLKMFDGIQTLVSKEEGQDLVEYALVVALVAFGATVAMSQLGEGISSGFDTISSTVASAM
jgi:pilus assembly protein Flp/PilA